VKQRHFTIIRRVPTHHCQRLLCGEAAVTKTRNITQSFAGADLRGTRSIITVTYKTFAWIDKWMDGRMGGRMGG